MTEVDDVIKVEVDDVSVLEVVRTSLGVGRDVMDAFLIGDSFDEIFFAGNSVDEIFFDEISLIVGFGIDLSSNEGGGAAENSFW